MSAAHSRENPRARGGAISNALRKSPLSNNSNYYYYDYNYNYAFDLGMGLVRSVEIGPSFSGEGWSLLLRVRVWPSLPEVGVRLFPWGSVWPALLGCGHLSFERELFLHHCYGALPMLQERTREGTHIDHKHCIQRSSFALAFVPL